MGGPPAYVLFTASQNLKVSLKRKGEFAESFFQLRDLALGFLVSKLSGDSAPADFNLEWPGRLCRIQVKSAWTIVKGGYKINTVTNGSGRHTCRPAEIDFYACIAMLLGVTYIVPVAAVKPGQKCLFSSLFPSVAAAATAACPATKNSANAGTFCDNRVTVYLNGNLAT